MKKHLLIGLILTSLVLLSCSLPGIIRLSTIVDEEVRGSGNVITEEREVSGITGVTLATLGDLTIEIGEPESLRLEGDDNLLELIETPVRDGMLTIQVEGDANLDPTQPIRYTLIVNELDTVVTASLGSIIGPELPAVDFTAKINSIGDIRLDGLIARSLDAELDSLGDLDIGGGELDTLQLTINSSGSYLAPDVRSQTADIKINSSGNATVWVTEEIDVLINSSGKVNYYGDPSVSSEVNSSGKLVGLGDK
jgi:hypothetical protein